VVGTWHDPELDRPIAAPLKRCAELLGVDLNTILEAASNIEPYPRRRHQNLEPDAAAGAPAPAEAYGRRRGGYLDRRRTLAGDR
jgi:hypothetical protein